MITAIEAAGGQVIEGPTPAPNGDRLIARHPDGSVFEYIETATRRYASAPGTDAGLASSWVAPAMMDE